MQGKKVCFRYAEGPHSVFYAPVYVAVSLGFCSQEELDVEVYAPKPNEDRMAMVARGEVDATQSAPSAGLLSLDKGEANVPLHFAQINRRDGFFIVQRPKRKSFQWKDLEGAELLPAAFAPQPWLSLQYALRKQGVDVSKIRLIKLPSLNAQEDAFRKGQGDFVHLQQPYTERLIAQGVGVLAAAVGPVIGNVAFSSLAAERERLLHQDPAIASFCRAFYRAQRWIQKAPPHEVARAVQPYFQDTDLQILSKSVKRYQDMQTWASSPLISESDYEVIQDIFFTGGAIKKRYSYEQVVDTAIAKKVMAEVK